MSIKKYFDVASNIKSLSNKTAEEIASQIESVAYHEQDIIKEERFIPRVDYSNPENFARYGSAKEYYDASIKRIYNTFPYDGSLNERLEWENDSTYIDLHIYDNQYPRTNGYIVLSAGGWGAAAGSITDGYGLPLNTEYIYFKGGPHTNPNGMSPFHQQFTGSNYYEPSMNRQSNLQADISSKGVSVEFWLKKDGFITGFTEKEVIFDLWNSQASSSADYARLRIELTGSGHDVLGAAPFRLTLLSGTTGEVELSLASSAVTTASVADANWHHYALTLGKTDGTMYSRFYVDGQVDNEQAIAIGTEIGDFYDVGLKAYLGALITSPSGSTAAAGAGKLSASLDEFRYWKTRRTSEQIGRFWFTQVGGGVNSDPAPFIETSETVNTNLGVYYKFNEGITGTASVDSVVLDYAGRVSNGTWTGYTTSSRNTGSAIVLSSAAIKEFKDPIIHSFHPEVVRLKHSLEISGSIHDETNNASIYNTMPNWIIEEDNEGEGELKKLTQIIASYFDTLQLQIESLPGLKEISYTSGSIKPLPFASRLLESQGFVAPEIFLDADVLERLADRSETKIYEKSLAETKNIIYENIYNNLTYIYKTKGTIKSLRNLIRCFGVDDELLKINTYADNAQYEIRNNRRNVVVGDKFVNFNTSDNVNATVFNFADPSNANTKGFIYSNAQLENGYALTLESEILFPKKLDEQNLAYVNTNIISSSLFGVHGAFEHDTDDTTWAYSDATNFQVYAARDERSSTNIKFVLTGTVGGYVPPLESPLYQNVYDNTRWNLSVRIRPEKYPMTSFVLGADPDNYVVELHGVQAESGELLQQFTVSGTVTAPPSGFITGSRRTYIGAHRLNFTGSDILQTSDVKVNSCRYWLGYLDDETLAAHILDTENYGALQPHWYAYSFNPSASNGDITEFDTLVFNWEFLTNTGSNASGQFVVDDMSSGSANFTRFGALGPILNSQYSAKGYAFPASSTAPIDKDYVVSSKLNLPEHIHSVDMIRVLNAEDQKIFTSESRPEFYSFAFEKSMYQVISEEILNYFATLKDINDLIGAPVNQFRPQYKSINFMRRKFFEKVGNDELDFEKFYEFYKWFDTSLSVMLSQLIPASAEFINENVLTVIENHILERPKYQRKFPILEKLEPDEISNGEPNSVWLPASMPPMTPMNPPGSPALPNTAFTKRQIGSSNTIQVTPWKFLHAPPSTARDNAQNDKRYWQEYRKERLNEDRSKILDAIKQSYNRRIGSPVKFSVDASVTFGGLNRHSSNRPGYVFPATAPFGGQEPGTNAMKNVMVAPKADVERLIETGDEYHPSRKQRLGFGMNPGANTDEPLKADGNIYAPISVYSSSVTTGYNSQVVSSWKPGVMVTDLHKDLINNHDIPLQGPFTEKFVGGHEYRHTALNQGSDTTTTRAEGWRIALEGVSSSAGGLFSEALCVIPPNSLGVSTLSEIPTAARLRDATAKRPVNVKNILMTSASAAIQLSGSLQHDKIGNYQKNYEIIQSAGRTVNDLYFRKQVFSFASNPETTATRGKFPLAITSTENVGGDLDYELPDRDGPNSNQTIIVNRFSDPGSYEVMSRGYLDPPHEELSVYNALPYRNRGVINHGMSGSDIDPSLTSSIRVTDQLGKPRGLNQLATLHAGRFGYDPVFGSIPTLTYITQPSYHKTNRNPKTRIETGELNVKVYDNLFVQYAIPRSTQQYAWVTASLGSGETIYGLSGPTCTSASVLSKLIVSSSAYEAVNFVGLVTSIIDPVSASSHILGFPLDVGAEGAYPNPSYWDAPAFDKTPDYFNSLMLERNGPYQYPTWKQIRTGEHPIARQLRKTNLIGAGIPPTRIRNKIRGRQRGYITPTRPNDFVDYFEAPINSKYNPIYFYFESDSGSTSNLVVSVPYGNNLDYFAHEGLNNRLALTIDLDQASAYSAVVDYTLASDLSVIVNYSERIYPANINAYNDTIRGRTRFSINNIWNSDRATRTTLGSLPNSQGHAIALSSIWPLDGHLNFTTTASVGAQDGAGELMNSYSRYSGSVVTTYKVATTRPAATYAMRVEAGKLTCNSASAITATGSIVFAAAAGDGEKFFFTGSSSEFVYKFVFTGSGYDGTAYPIHVERAPSAAEAAENLYNAITASNFVALSGGAASYSAGTTKVQLSQSSAGTEGNTVIGGDISEATYFGFGGGVTGSSGSCCDPIVLAGDAMWEAATQSGKNPYVPYSTYAEKIRLLGKDKSIVPEFRISQFVETYFETNEENFLADLDNILELTGASIPNSSEAGFFKTYTNSDFLKYFKVIDEDLNYKRDGARRGWPQLDQHKIERDRISLKCSALLKFLPYKGFYPADRTVDLATLFSQSYTDGLMISSPGPDAIAYRALLEPLYAPGIMYNTIKSGIAVSNFILANTSSSPSDPVPDAQGFATELPEGNIDYKKILALDSASVNNKGYIIQQIPFEALYEPAKYFNKSFLSGTNIYDTGVGNAALATGSVYVTPDLRGKKLYDLAIDNFLCETVNFFCDDLTSFVSNREDDFSAVRADNIYTMTLKLYRPLAKTAVNRDLFDMYTRTSAFGTPLAANVSANNYSASFSHVTPPYFAGAGRVTFAYTASFDGMPSLEDIFSNTSTSFTRQETVTFGMGDDPDFDPRMQVDSCFNLADYITEVPSKTTSQASRWLIQSKFETPILNFAGVSYSKPPSSCVSAGTSSADEIILRGLWHQYGSAPTGSNVGVFAVIEDNSNSSLADVVGFPTGRPAQVGRPREAYKLEEAVVAIPFKTVKNRRKFFKVTKKMRKTASYENLTKAMEKYIFPPKFDFTRSTTVDPILMYTFEFSADLDQSDISDIWQNLPPDIADKFEQKEVIVDDERLVDLLVNNSENIQWLVFKVKKRAKKDFEKFRRSLVTSNTAAISSKIGEYSYNWPYDYFSLIELIKIDEGIQYVSSDLTEKTDSTVEISGPVDINVVNAIALTDERSET